MKELVWGWWPMLWAEGQRSGLRSASRIQPCLPSLVAAAAPVVAEVSAPHVLGAFSSSRGLLSTGCSSSLGVRPGQGSRAGPTLPGLHHAQGLGWVQRGQQRRRFQVGRQAGPWEEGPKSGN